MRLKMRLRRLTSICVISVLLLLLAPFYEAHCQSYVEYKIQVNGDGSADWIVTRVSGIDTDIDVIGFQEKVVALVDAAADVTQREMAVAEDSLQMVDEIYWETQSRKTVYAFTWQNFSSVEDGKITFGDVFGVAGFFGQLYGEGALQISYPSTCTVVSVTPRPDERDDLSQTLKWLGTDYFINAEHEIVLMDNSQSSNDSEWQQYAIIAAALAVAAATLLAGFYVFRRRKAKTRAFQTAAAAGVPRVESNEEKIIKVIRSSGGSMRQSAITERCRFSKAKTSQLLSALERKGVIKRYKRGRDKIVTLTDKVTGEH
jgi:uncharacterized membrane protein